MLASLVVAAFHNANTLPKPDTTILHGARSRQNQSKKVVRLSENNSLKGSIGWVGARGDNAAMESYFALLLKNVFTIGRWETSEKLRPAIVIWIETRYNHKRHHAHWANSHPSSLKQLSNRTRSLEITKPKGQPNREQSPPQKCFQLMERFTSLKHLAPLNPMIGALCKAKHE